MDEFDIVSELEEFNQELDEAEIMHEFVSITEDVEELVFDEVVPNETEDYETPIEIDDSEFEDIDLDDEKEEDAFSPSFEDDFLNELNTLNPFNDESPFDTDIEKQLNDEILSVDNNENNTDSLEDKTPQNEPSSEEQLKRTNEIESTENQSSSSTTSEEKDNHQKQGILENNVHKSSENDSDGKISRRMSRIIPPKPELEQNKRKSLLSQRMSERNQRNAEQKRMLPFSDKKQDLKFEKKEERDTTNEIKKKFLLKQTEKIIDDIVLEVETFTKNNSDITAITQEEIKEQKKNEEKQKPIEQPKQYESKIEIEQHVSETEQNDMVVSLEKKSEQQSQDTQNAKDKNDEDVSTTPISPLRKYDGREAPKEEITFAKPKEAEVETNAPIIMFALVDIGLSGYVALTANAYSNSTKGKVTGIIDCIKGGFLEDYQFTITPINTTLVSFIFLGLALIIGLFGYLKFNDAKEKKKSKVGFEHGNAKFGTKKDFIEFKKDFMDMS